MTRALALALLLAACATGPGIVLPPARYDHEPTRHFKDIRMPYWEIDTFCRTFGPLPPGRVIGCAHLGPAPTRVVPNDVDAAMTAALIRHENGHLNGWPADHRDGHF